MRSRRTWRPLRARLLHLLLYFKFQKKYVYVEFKLGSEKPEKVIIEVDLLSFLDFCSLNSSQVTSLQRHARISACSALARRLSRGPPSATRTPSSIELSGAATYRGGVPSAAIALTRQIRREKELGVQACGGGCLKMSRLQSSTRALGMW